MRKLIALLIFALLPASAMAQTLLSSSGALVGTSTPLVLTVLQYQEYNITLTANTAIQFNLPVIAGTLIFRLNLCENGVGGFAPVYSIVQSGNTLVNNLGGTMFNTAANACETQQWSWRQQSKQLVLESDTAITGQPSQTLPINQLPNQSGSYNAQGFAIGGLPAVTASNQALSEGHSIGGTTPAAGTFTALTSTSSLTASGTNSVTDTSANGSSKTSGLCIDGICAGTAFGMKVANSDNSTNLQAAINAAYESGTSSATKGKVLITPDSTGGTTYTFTSGVDFKDVPVQCQAGRNSGNSPGVFNITLNFTATSGIAIAHAGSFKDCRVIGGFTAGNGLSATISSITDGANNQATVVTTASNTTIAGGHVIISGTTNFNGVYPVASVTNGTAFVISVGKAGLATENAGTVTYYPTVGVMATSPTTDLAAGAVDWENLFVQGFGTDYNLSGIQSGAGSINDWSFVNNYAGVAPIGVLANGNGFPVGGINSNVSGGKAQILTCVSTAICWYGGPMVNTSSNISDTEEDSFGDNDISKIDFESQDSNSTDSPYVAGIWVGSYGNNIHDNYTSVGSSGGGGQTAKGSIRTADDTGPNWVVNNRVSSQPAGLVLNTAVDEAHLNVPGISANQSEGRAFLSGISLAAKGQTPNLISSKCNGTCATAGSGGTVNSYAIVGIGWDGNKSTASPQFICSDGSYVSSGGSCAGTVTGPNPYSGSNFVTVCWNPDPNFKAYDILINDTAHSTHLAFASGSNGNNCFSDTSGSSSGYTAPTNDGTGGINEANTHTANTFGQVSITPAIDEALNVSNGGHISSLIGSGAAPTSGTGSVTAGGTDNAFEVTGGTSPVTVTFGTAFHAAPVCVCSDETAALGACKATSSTTAHVIITTASTDSFFALCIGK